MSFYQELDSLSLEELISHWYGHPIDGEEYSALYYQELAISILNQGEAGRTFLKNILDKSLSVEELGAILSNLPSQEYSLPQDLLLPYLHDDRPLVIAAAIDGLATQREHNSLDEILLLRQHSSPYVRGSVLRFLSVVQTQEAIPVLIEALQDSHYIVRENAIDELDSLGATESIPLIRSLLNDSNLEVQQAAQTAVKNLEESLQ
jgi:HEAT repeat protein